MKKIIILLSSIFFLLLIITIITNNISINHLPQNNQKPKINGLWVSAVTEDGLFYTTEANFKQQVAKLILKMNEYKLTDLFYQVRPTSDALYHSKLNPPSIYIYKNRNSQKNTVFPKFDNIDYLINEVRRNGIRFHAWFNPYRVSLGSVNKTTFLDSLANNSFPKANSEMIITDSTNKLFLNPAFLEVQNSIIDSIVEFTSDYKVDGIHFDDYFYPYNEFDDYSSYQLLKDENQSIDDFRRENVNDLIKKVSTEMRLKNIIFSISPFGIWRNKKNDIRGSNTNGLESYSDIYADTHYWVKNELIDYIIPQLYFATLNPNAKFNILLDWWIDLVKDTNVSLSIGVALYKIIDDKYFLLTENDLISQFNLIKEKEQTCSLFSYQFLFNENKQLNDALKRYKYLFSEL